MQTANSRRRHPPPQTTSKTQSHKISNQLNRKRDGNNRTTKTPAPIKDHGPVVATLHTSPDRVPVTHPMMDNAQVDPPQTEEDPTQANPHPRPNSTLKNSSWSSCWERPNKITNNKIPKKRQKTPHLHNKAAQSGVQPHSSIDNRTITHEKHCFKFLFKKLFVWHYIYINTMQINH